MFSSLDDKENKKMQLIPRLFIGGHRELRRPENDVDQSLMERIEEARERLRREGRDIKPLRSVRTGASEGARRTPYA